jgi:uncharacterized membrane protein YdbT with pleckstrin-like domain
MAKSYLESLLGAHEKIVIVTRQHWFTLASSILLECVLILIFLVATVVTVFFFQPLAPLLIVIGFILSIIPLITMGRDILVWTNRQYIVTNRRVMQISGLFNKNVTDSSLDKVNDVKMSQSALGRLFGYGDIEILTASELGVNLFRRIGEPIRFKTAMLNAKERLERGAEGEVLPDSDEIPALIANLDHLRQQGILTEEEFQEKKTDLLSRI